MKTTVYAVRDEKGTRVSYRYRSIMEAKQVKDELEIRNSDSKFEVYRTTQDLPRINRRHTW